MSERTRCLDNLRALIADLEVAMLTTVRRDGRLVSRPLRTIAATGSAGDELWFLVRKDSHKIEEIEGAPEVNLAYAAPGRNSFVSVSGRARIVENRAKVAEMWTPAMSLFFPEGPQDRAVVLLRVDVTGAEYWDGPGTWLGQALDLASKLVTGEAKLTSHHAIDVKPGH